MSEEDTEEDEAILVVEEDPEPAGGKEKPTGARKRPAAKEAAPSAKKPRTTSASKGKGAALEPEVERAVEAVQRAAEDLPPKEEVGGGHHRRPPGQRPLTTAPRLLSLASLQVKHSFMEDAKGFVSRSDDPPLRGQKEGPPRAHPECFTGKAAPTDTALAEDPLGQHRVCVSTAAGRGRHAGIAQYIPTASPPNRGPPLPPLGMTFVISGVMDSLFKGEMEDLIKRHNGRVTGSVSSKTTFLVVGSQCGKTKWADAEKHKASRGRGSTLLRPSQEMPRLLVFLPGGIPCRPGSSTRTACSPCCVLRPTWHPSRRTLQHRRRRGLPHSAARR